MASARLQDLLAMEVVETRTAQVDKEMRLLIRRLGIENRLWTAERIHDHLVLLGYAPHTRTRFESTW
jgi:hypothetical protein